MKHACTAPEEYGPRLAALRGAIDAADQKILHLLNERALLSLDVGLLKTQRADSGEPADIFDPQRERRVLENLAVCNNGPLPMRHVENIWREIFSSSRALQKPQRIAYLGPEGTFSHRAALAFLGASPEFVGLDDLAAVFRSVQEEECELGVVPLENSLQGTVGQTLDLFLEHTLGIRAELFHRISHGLLSRETSPDAVRVIYSHSQPLAQCANRLRSLLPGARLVPVESTAAAARRAAQEPGTAALGHRDLADPLHLHLLAEHMEDTPDNRTRFAVIGRKSAFPQQCFQAKDKNTAMISSLLFTLPDKVGALAGVLNTLASAGLNLRKLESRPLRCENWKYAFFADAEGDLEHHAQAQTVAKLGTLCALFRILGVYPSGLAS